MSLQLSYCISHVYNRLLDISPEAWADWNHNDARSSRFSLYKSVHTLTNMHPLKHSLPQLEGSWRSHGQAELQLSGFVSVKNCPKETEKQSDRVWRQMVKLHPKNEKTAWRHQYGQKQSARVAWHSAEHNASTKALWDQTEMERLFL